MRGLIILAGFCVAFGCATNKDDSSYITLDGQAQGTTFHIVYKDSLQRNFSTSIDSIFRMIDKSMSLWDTSSVISRINRNEGNVIPDEHFINVFLKAQEVSKETDGAFDVTIGPLLKAWGFHAKNGSPPPDSATVSSVLLKTGYEKVSLESGVIKKTAPDIQLDFNAIAQGYTVDLIAAFLQSKSCTDFLVEVGGELRTRGLNPRKEDWQVGIDKPLEEAGRDRPLQTTIPLVNKSLATSGNYRKYVLSDGRKRGHIIDPSTGYPVDHDVLSVSVIADDCMTADAYATAFLVMGMDDGLEYARKAGLEVYCIYSDSSGKIEVTATPGFLK